MFIQLRMFASHPLVAHNVLRQALDDEVMKEVSSIESEEGQQDTASLEICRCLRRMMNKKDNTQTSEQAHGSNTGEVEQQRKRDSALRHKLNKDFLDFLDKISKATDIDFNEVLKCASCKDVPTPAFVTSCYHLYCEECYEKLPKSEAESEENLRNCSICQVAIIEAAHLDGFDYAKLLKEYNAQIASTNGAVKRKRTVPMNRKGLGVPKRKVDARGKRQKSQASEANERSRSCSIAGSTSIHCSEDELQIGSTDDEDDEEWDLSLGSGMPGAKFSEIREVVKKWIQEDQNVKIVIFTQFLGTLVLLKDMCTAEGWDHVSVCYGLRNSIIERRLTFSQISGKVSENLRDKYVNQFQEDDSIRLLLSTKVGDTGLNLDSANKCILIDLWWNKDMDSQVS